MRVLALMLFSFVPSAQAWAATGCAPTIQDAVRVGQPELHAAATAGYRVVALRGDALRDGMWAMVEVCGHPELPLMMVRVMSPAGLSVAPVTRLPVIHIGDEVTVLARTGSSLMVLHGWAEQSGAVDSKVRVRLPRFVDDDTVPLPKIECRVTGAGSVEVVQ